MRKSFSINPNAALKETSSETLGEMGYGGTAYGGTSYGGAGYGEVQSATKSVAPERLLTVQSVLTPPNESTSADKKASFLQTWGKNCPRSTWRTSEKHGLTAVICDPKGGSDGRRTAWPQDYTFFSNKDPSQEKFRRVPCPVKGKMWRSLQFRPHEHPMPSDQMMETMQGQAGTSESRTGVAFGGGYVALQICGGAMYVDKNAEHKTTLNPFCRGREILAIKADRILARKKVTLSDPETRRWPWP